MATVETETRQAVLGEMVDLIAQIREVMRYSEVALEFTRDGGPQIVIEDENVSMIALAQLMAMVEESATGIGWEIWDRRLTASTATWPPDRIPF